MGRFSKYTRICSANIQKRKLPLGRHLLVPSYPSEGCSNFRSFGPTSSHMGRAVGTLIRRTQQPDLKRLKYTHLPKLPGICIIKDNNQVMSVELLQVAVGSASGMLWRIRNISITQCCCIDSR